MSGGSLDRHAVLKAAWALTVRGRYWFSRRNLFHELERREQLGAPSEPHDFEWFAEQLQAHELSSGPVPRMVRPEDVPQAVDRASLPPDVFDYAVRRVLVFQRLDPLLVFAKSNFHHKIVVALVTEDGFPAHVWSRLREQLDAGLSTTFYGVHDCTPAGYGMTERLLQTLAGWERARLSDLGLRVAHAMDLGVPLRRGTPTDPDEMTAADPEERQMLAEGSHAYFEELRPIRAMRWAYRCLARRSEDEGFG